MATTKPRSNSNAGWPRKGSQSGSENFNGSSNVNGNRNVSL